LQPGKPLPLKIAKAAALAIALCLFSILGFRLTGRVLASPVTLPLVALGVLVGYLAADLMSGTVHWFCDTFFAEDTPLIGPTVILPFRDHHRHPEAITGYRLLEQDGTNYVILILPLWLAVSAAPAGGSLLGLAGLSALWGLALGSLGTNLFHKWAHSDGAPAVVRWLQRRRLILSPESHAVHHRSYTGGYCVTNGWMNPLLDRLDAFGRVERLVRRRRPRP
jgi:ubiquitin-conjugating enzyme E2 variant